ncbi:ATP-binding protein [Polyangium sp. y55x31]|uniref:methylation-associated defense system AAA family ATPase MAD3 n=1 Tax=Polyangium sp. y55x31 TaxID=3042688 RepID=UPI002482DE3D|nr:ATP-binding protein [Polyangium sp. y55x31]MDI1476003.1 AAA family ATPase [Polyangium sp. y55x31]
MITRVEALGYRCLRYIRQPLGSLHALVGPNASGKSTFLDVIAFLGSLVRRGPQAAVEERTKNFQDLVWRRDGRAFELAIEVDVPEALRSTLARPDLVVLRYEVRVALDPETDEVGLDAERLSFGMPDAGQELLFSDPTPPVTILTPTPARNRALVVNKTASGNDNFYAETREAHQGRSSPWTILYKLSRRRSALGNLPEDESLFPVATWFKRFLLDDVQEIALRGDSLRLASPPGQRRRFKPDGSNLPWVVADLEKRDSERHRQWLEHLQTALPDLEGIQVVDREDDRHRYLVLRYAGGLEVPSWSASDGTLRMLALTLPAYLLDLPGIFLIEEPENGIHPRAIEAVYHSLSSVYDAQILLATHSPVTLGVVDPKDVLCFSRTMERGTDIVRGTDHPALRDWKGEPSLGVVFAAGVLG